ncbi:MAG: aminodeoxychorismate synthase component I [Rothia sp. (in: high G+C Gram-positive bacteria)]|uniref:aminodeoxychorismate synthase component I n=1 Tax=Rothia sp. (in: high G+C Gram-positive bacteria) TaxID=1885016 RepID=UPI0026DFA8E3|nr:aminodeoxychorismate synthase component I [Rothia sp. (in: high G+C Gram-positive bacteria)]MDO5749675.1 aminodeoxychorismate synthase component I [Rothia sp. (in: high G+C Gram-positive bacteria)]
MHTVPLVVRALTPGIDPAAAFRLIATDDYAFWLDSARAASPMSRISYIGTVPDSAQVIRCEDARTANPWEALESALVSTPRPESDAQLPEGLLGGYVGFWGYEARASLQPGTPGYTPEHTADTPDALWMPAVRYMVHEHATGASWLVGDQEWIESIAPHLNALVNSHAQAQSNTQPAQLPEGFPLIFTAPDREEYLAAIEHSQREIFEGNSYEVCLTARTAASASAAPSREQLIDMYSLLREHNPAPYAALLLTPDMAVLSSSPERFLTLDSSGVIESKPIKGTVPRGATEEEDAQAAAWLQEDIKTRAENLMIVDLLRNDLSTVCEPGSVRVPVLMGVESYQTVHQLVSTIRGHLRPDISAVRATAACFPGGSMTGAPKPETMRIIQRLEQRARGVYSGALGFYSANGSSNLSIVIRTLVVSGREFSISAGGAIVADSSPQAEYEEMLTKLRAALPASLGVLK